MTLARIGPGSSHPGPIFEELADDSAHHRSARCCAQVSRGA
jgi:hypothetical protein